jgi:hypothetical protein
LPTKISGVDVGRDKDPASELPKPGRYRVWKGLVPDQIRQGEMLAAITRRYGPTEVSRMATSGNAFLPGFIERYNARFARIPARPADLHRPLNLTPDRLRAILCRREQHYVGAQLAFSYERKRIMLEENNVA